MDEPEDIVVSEINQEQKNSLRDSTYQLATREAPWCTSSPQIHRDRQ